MEKNLEYQTEATRIEAVADMLRGAGIAATSQDTGGGTLCVVVDLPNEHQIIWGTADVNWGGAIQDADGECVAEIGTDCPSHTEDVAAIAHALKRTSLANGEPSR